MKKLFQSIVIAIFIISNNLYIQAAPPVAIIQEAKASVESIRYQLPVEVGYGIMMTQVIYDSKTYSLVYSYHFTVPAIKPTSESINEIRTGLIHMFKANPNSEEMKYLKSGITFHYNYYSQDGDFLYSIKLTPDDFK